MLHILTSAITCGGEVATDTMKHGSNIVTIMKTLDVGRVVCLQPLKKTLNAFLPSQNIGCCGMYRFTGIIFGGNLGLKFSAPIKKQKNLLRKFLSTMNLLKNKRTTQPINQPDAGIGLWFLRFPMAARVISGVPRDCVARNRGGGFLPGRCPAASARRTHPPADTR